MASKIIFLEEIKQGTYMYWNICTQACFDFKVEIKDSGIGKVYFSKEKAFSQSGDIYNLSDGSNLATVMGDNLTIEITSTYSKELKSSINSYGVNDTSGKTIGKGYNICIEDSDDNDFNDLYINIIAWEKRG
ncbi:MAG: hypothetical protein R3Y50_07515 [Rikenellaceae bacterium]